LVDPKKLHLRGGGRVACLRGRHRRDRTGLSGAGTECCPWSGLAMQPGGVCLDHLHQVEARPVCVGAPGRGTGLSAAADIGAGRPGDVTRDGCRKTMVVSTNADRRLLRHDRFDEIVHTIDTLAAASATFEGEFARITYYCAALSGADSALQAPGRRQARPR
jgi:hypothetical protein